MLYQKSYKVDSLRYAAAYVSDERKDEMMALIAIKEDEKHTENHNKIMNNLERRQKLSERSIKLSEKKMELIADELTGAIDKQEYDRKRAEYEREGEKLEREHEKLKSKNKN